MSLQVWLPLNGDLHNQGLFQTNINSTAFSVNNSGKIGQCIKTNTTTGIDLGFNGNQINTGSISFGGWFKFNKSEIASAVNGKTYASNATSATGNLIGNNSYGGVSLQWVSNNIYSSGNFSSISVQSCIRTSTNGHRATTAFTLPFDTWTHIFLTYNKDNNLLGLWINGKLEYTNIQVPFTDARSYNLFINLSGIAGGNGPGAYIPFYCNDIRIYDHCLSAKEVEEISKGLVLHYKLNNDGFGNENYWGNGKPLNDGSLPGELRTMYSRTNSAYASVPIFIPNQYIEIKLLSTRTPVENGGIQFQKLQRYNETVNSMCPILEHLKTGEQLIISYELYITSPLKVLFHLSKILDGVSTKVQPDINSIQISTLNAWTKVSQSIEIPSSFDESNITTESRLGMYISIREILGTTSSDEVTIRIRNIKFEKGQVATDWTPAKADFGHSSDDIIYDSSGYGNNGTIIGSLEAIISSPRYDCATHFSGSPNCINAWRGAMVRDAITVSCWGYMDNWSNYNTRLLSCTEGGGWNFEPSSGKMQFAISTGASGSTYKNAVSTITLASLSAGWHLFTGTYDGFTTKIYIDGELQGTNNAYTTKTLIFYHSSNSAFIGAEASSSATTPAGNYFVGNISDVRIYATALTIDQIKELYNTSATIDKNGNIYARELVEE